LVELVDKEFIKVKIVFTRVDLKMIIGMDPANKKRKMGIITKGFSNMVKKPLEL